MELTALSTFAFPAFTGQRITDRRSFAFLDNTEKSSCTVAHCASDYGMTRTEYMNLTPAARNRLNHKEEREVEKDFRVWKSAYKAALAWGWAYYPLDTPSHIWRIGVQDKELQILMKKRGTEWRIESGMDQLACAVEQGEDVWTHQETKRFFGRRIDMRYYAPPSTAQAAGSIATMDLL